jgi:hypothetical protein
MGAVQCIRLEHIAFCMNGSPQQCPLNGNIMDKPSFAACGRIILLALSMQVDFARERGEPDNMP